MQCSADIDGCVLLCVCVCVCVCAQSGFIGANVWVADKKTADATTATPGAVPTDYHGAYASQQGVIGLPRLNWTHIRTQYRSVESDTQRHNRTGGTGDGRQNAPGIVFAVMCTCVLWC